MTIVTLAAGGVIAWSKADGPNDTVATTARAVDIDPETARQRAQQTGQPVEASAENTENNTTYANPDGTFTRRMSPVPIRARKDGRWTAIDPTFDRTSDGYTTRSTVSTITVGTGKRITTAPTSPATTDTSKPPTHGRTSGTTVAPGSSPRHRAAAGPGHTDKTVTRQDITLVAAMRALPAVEPGQEIVRMTTSAHTLSMSWPRPLPKPEVAGNEALYREILPGVDLLITAEADGFSQLLIVKNKQAADQPELRTLTYGLSSDTLRFRLDDSGAIQAVDNDDAEIAAAPTPYMWDSGGTPAEQDTPASPPATASLRDVPAVDGPLAGAKTAVVPTELDGTTLTLRPSADLLDSPDTVYPVIVDPSFKGKTTAWSLVYKNHPSSTFWNGSGFNRRTDEARVGFESTTWGTSRSYFRLNWDLKDDDIISDAGFRAFETYSWSCKKREFSLYWTGAISSSTSWNNQPEQLKKLGTLNAAHGYNSNCKDDWIRFDVKAFAQQAADGNWPAITFKLQAADENDKWSWKKFQDTPHLDVVFNTKPKTPTGLAAAPLGGCRTAKPYPTAGITDLTFKARAWDKNANLKAIHLRIWQANDPTQEVMDADVSVIKDKKDPRYGSIEPRLADDKFKNGVTYLWNAYAVDTWNAKSPTTGTCGLTIDHTKPNPPKVESQQFPDGDEGSDDVWVTKLGNPGTFTFTGGGADTAKYIYSFEAPGYANTATMTGTTGTSNPKDQPTHAGPNVLYVKSVDKAGNQSDATLYLFYVKPRDTLDSPGDTTGDKFPDLFAINSTNDLELYASDNTGDSNQPLNAARDAPTGYWNGALITHNGDYWAGDGMQDLIARMPDKKLWIYPGTGLGGVNTTQRVQLRLPDGAPDPGTYRQILSVGDISGDNQPDLLVTTGDQLWALIGYTGGHLSQAIRIPSTEWTNRSVISLTDHNGDGAADLVYRATTGLLYLRHGKKTGGKTDLTSLATAASSATGKDTLYSHTSWDTTNIRLTAGTPDATGDGNPDIWVIKNDHTHWIYPGGTTTQAPGRKIALATDGHNWTDTKALG